MKRVFSSELNSKHSSNHLLWVSLVLLLGVICGVLNVSFLNLTSKQALFTDVTGFLYAEPSQEMTYLQSLWQMCRMPIIVLLLAFTCFGVVGIPIAVGIQGYLYSFSVAVLVRLLGWNGILLGIAKFGIQAFFAIPCLLLVAAQGVSLSKQFFLSMIRIRTPELHSPIFLPRGFLLAVLLCVILLLAGAAVDVFITEILTTFVLHSAIL